MIFAGSPGWADPAAAPTVHDDASQTEADPGSPADGPAADEDAITQSSAATEAPLGQGVTQLDTSAEATTEEDAPSSPLSMNYFGIFYGPGLKEMGAYQPTGSGDPDPTRPVQMKNLVGIGYAVTDKLSITPTAFFLWRPIGGQQLVMQDPFLKVSYNSVISTEEVNLYSDLRFHFPVTSESRESDMLAGFQTLQVFTYQLGASRFTLGANASARYNYFGKHGSGSDLELYLAPNVAYQVTPTLAVTVLYEMGASHNFGDNPGDVYNDGTDLEPGVSWDITPNLMVNPYLILYPGNTISLRSTSIGLNVAWTMF